MTGDTVPQPDARAIIISESPDQLIVQVDMHDGRSFCVDIRGKDLADWDEKRALLVRGQTEGFAA